MHSLPVSFRWLVIFIAVFCQEASAIDRVEVKSWQMSQNDFKSNTMYVISSDVWLDGKVEMPDNVILNFQGGSFVGGALVGQKTDIYAPDYYIFKDVKVSGTFSDEGLSVHWFGAVGDGKTDDAWAINKIFSMGKDVCAKFLNRVYRVDSPIIMNQNYQRLDCPGTIVTDKNIAVLDLQACDLNINVSRLSYDGDGNGKASAVLFSGNVYNSNITLGSVRKFRTGLDFTPKLSDGREYAGSQYNKVSWQLIDCERCIYINLWDNPKASGVVWCNENQFFGGRLMGGYGLLVERGGYDNPKADRINGNVFQCIGFEHINTPISARHMWYNNFYDMRMNESIYGSKYIDLKDCAFLIFGIKTSISNERIATEGCGHIEFSGSYTDSGIGYGQGYYRHFVQNSDPNKLSGENESIISTNISSRNIVQSINVVENTDLNFNDLFARHYDGTLVMSDMCRITSNANTTLSVQFEKSIYKMRPDMTLRCNVLPNAKIAFLNGDKVIGTITRSGTYRITYTVSFAISIIPISYD